MSPTLRRALSIGLAIVGAIAVAALITSLFGTEEFDDEPDDVPDPVAQDEFYDDVIISPPAMGKLTTSIVDMHGQFVGVRCSTCHGDGNIGEPPARQADELQDFHTDMDFAHGDLACSSCHAADDRDKLTLADGTLVDYEDTMDLCAQCHSSQYKSYQHGAHGGMSGHWDQSQGSRVRNDCVVCHDPHEPAFPQVTPADPPRDRFFGDQ